LAQALQLSEHLLIVTLLPYQTPKGFKQRELTEYKTGSQDDMYQLEYLPLSAFN
jgi:hypothetical protein